MALVMTLQITAGTRLQEIETLEVKRLEPLRPSERPDLEVYNYRARIYPGEMAGHRGTGHTEEAFFVHTYGDGARVCIARAIRALAKEDPA